MSLHAFISTFNSGEWSPLLANRSDLDKYSSGCRILSNAVPMPYGPATSRAGMVYMGAAATPSSRVRLIPFNFSTTTGFILELSDLALRFWSNGRQVTSGGSPYEVATPWSAATLLDIQWVEINDVVYLTDGLNPPQKLSRVADDNWTLEEIAWDFPPVRDENITATTISSSATTGTGVTLTSSSALFEAGHVGGYMKVIHRRDAAYVDVYITANGSSSSQRVVGPWELVTKGTWGADILIERSDDDGATIPWETIRSFHSDIDYNVVHAGNQEDETYLRVTVANHASPAPSSPPPANPRAMLTFEDAEITGVVKITAVASPTSATADVVLDLHSTAATKHWAEGAWSDKNGWPRAVALHQQRLLFGGTLTEPQTVWGSVTGDFENFRASTVDDGSFAYTLAAQESNRINWILSQRALLIGTTGEEWSMSGGGDNSPITPSNVKTERESRYGTERVPAIMAGESVVFCTRNGERFRELSYNFEKDGWIAPNLSVLAEHITRSGVVQMALQQQPEPIIWMVTADGILVGMTYDREQNVVAWHRHPTSGDVESVAVIYGDPPGSDEVWVSTVRSVNGSTVRYVERIDPAARTNQETDNKSAMIYTDAAAAVVNDPPSATVSGLAHLEGREVAILADGSVHPSLTVTGGSITLTRPASAVNVGLPYIATIQPNAIETPLPDGSSQGRRFRVNRVAVRFWKTLGCEVADDPYATVWDRIEFRDTSQPMDTSPPLFTGEKKLPISNRHRDSVDVAFRQTLPLPLTITGVTVKFDIHGT